MRSYGLFFSGIAVVLGIVLVGSRFPSSVTDSNSRFENQVLDYSRRGILADYDLPSIGYQGRIDLEYLNACVGLANKRYGWNLRGLALNPSILKPDIVNLVFFDEDPDGIFGPFRGNCAYTGSNNLIVCDLSFIRKIAGVTQKDPAIAAREYSDAMKNEDYNTLMESIDQSFRSMIAMWIIGHEIGHLAHRHTSKHFLFHGEAPSILVENPDGLATRRDYRIEKEADDFAFQVIKESEGSRGPAGAFLSFGLSSVVNEHRLKWYRDRNLPAPSDHSDLDRIEFVVDSSSKTHPPLLIRILDLAIRVAKELDHDPSGYFQKLRDQTIVRELK